MSKKEREVPLQESGLQPGDVIRGPEVMNVRALPEGLDQILRDLVEEVNVPARSFNKRNYTRYARYAK